ncbi:MAG: glycoside hydrolase family 57 protein [Candidatus Pacebacteria bacterium]|jgi:alpha-amylase|nr:glycoside hydrolase family 57 protein [Candidatus Paceibacterota bacterium]
MPSICLYLHTHQPRRLKRFSVFDIGAHGNYFDDDNNRAILERVARKSYLPTNRMLLDLMRRSRGRFKVSLSITGILLEQLEAEFPEALQSFKDLVDTGCCELVSETYYHSLASIYSRDEFARQVERQNAMFKRLFDYVPSFFRNTELVYNNSIASVVKEMGFTGMLAEGWDEIMGWRSPNFLYKAKGSDLRLLVRNYKLSDDIGFRFSNRDWKEWPLTAEKYIQWVNLLNIDSNAQTLNLFMDYETFGEHQWEETGIFKFFEDFCWRALEHPQNKFTTPSRLAKDVEPAGELDFYRLVSWADTERDLSAWTGNKMQAAALEKIYSLENDIVETGDEKLLDEWRKLQTSDHFYYMCTKWFSDGDVHKYFNPYESPYESFIAFMNIYNDLKIKTDKISQSKTKVNQ